MAHEISGRAAPVLAVSVALLRGDSVLLVRRGRAPSRGLYAFPGGRVEPGETLEQAARRELAEETGMAAAALVAHRTILIEPSDEAHPVYELTVFAGAADAGEAVAADDAEAVCWADRTALDLLPLTPSVGEIARELLSR